MNLIQKKGAHVKKIIVFIAFILLGIFLAYKFGLVDFLTDISSLRAYLEALGWQGYVILFYFQSLSLCFFYRDSF